MSFTFDNDMVLSMLKILLDLCFLNEYVLLNVVFTIDRLN